MIPSEEHIDEYTEACMNTSSSKEKKAVIIYNPRSGLERSPHLAERLKKRLKTNFDKIFVRPTTGPGAAARFAAEACRDRVHSIFVIGGDGTVNETIEGIIYSAHEHRPILGTIPGGTLNALARNLFMPVNPWRAVDALDLNQVTQIDIGCCNHRVFGFMFSIGPVSEAIHSVSSADKRRFAMLAYIVNIVRSATLNVNHPLRVIIDGKTMEGEFSHIVVMLVDRIGKFNFSAHPIRQDDGLMHVFLMKEATIWEKLTVVSDLIAGKLHASDKVQYHPARKVHIESIAGEVQTDVDGERGDFLPVDLTVRPCAIKVYSLEEEDLTAGNSATEDGTAGNLTREDSAMQTTEDGRAE